MITEYRRIECEAIIVDRERTVFFKKHTHTQESLIIISL